MLSVLYAPKQVYAQYWMQKSGSATVDEGYAISIDANGNTYTTGYFTGNATFGSTTLNSSGSTDIFLTKTDNQGNYIWAVKAGGSGSDRGLNIKTDPQGNSYVTGFFNGTANFGTQQIISSGNQDIFIAKYDPNGTLIWVVKAGGTGADIGNGIAVDVSGNIFITGTFNSTANFGTTVLTASGTNSDAFTTKLNASGTFLWTEQGSGPLNIKGVDVTTDNQGNVYVTGQFSGDITFDVLHTNTMLNVIFLVKYNNQGQEQWFKIIGAGVSNISNAITSDVNGNIYLTGDFTGSLTFFSTTNYTLSNTFSNKVFIAKYDNTGTLHWAEAIGSDNAITSKDIAVNGSGDPYIIGHFECVLDEFAVQFGEGTFNSVGYTDIFICKFTTSGTYEYSRNIGGRDHDYGYGLIINSTNEVHFTGSFSEVLFIPVSNDFLTANLGLWAPYNCSSNTSYCSDPDYGSYYGIPSSGNLDIAIANCFDPSRELYDFYLRAGSSCLRDQPNACIGLGCPDTISLCGSGGVVAYPNVCPAIGPEYMYQWGNLPFSSSNSTAVNLDSTLFVTVASVDGCFSSSDSIFAKVNPLTPYPTITDSKGINVNQTNPIDIDLCDNDTVVLTAGGIGTSNFLWTGDNLPSGGISNTNIIVDESGEYILTVVDSNGCEVSIDVYVTFYPPLPPFALGISAVDSFSICVGGLATYQLYDSVSNPNANPLCLTAGNPNPISTFWSVTPSTITGGSCETYGYVSPSSSGLFTVQAMVVRGNTCESDTHYVQKDIYVEVNPVPVINPFAVNINGSQSICPGDSNLLVATGAPNYLWLGPGINGIPNDSIYISLPGIYAVNSSLTITDSNGCSASHYSSASILVSIKPQPSVISEATLICPNDSIQLTSIGGGTDFYWEGPNGQIQGDSVIYATDPGQYFCIVNDSDSCELVTNTILLTQYSTPQLLANGDLYICDGDSLEISVIANDSSIVEWQFPLFGNGLTQTIYSPGTYTCKIISCGIITHASIDVLPSAPIASITLDSLLCKNSSTTLQGNGGMSHYQWGPYGDTTQSISINGPGEFVLTTTDTNGCKAISDTIVVSEVEIKATITNLNTDSLICFGDSLMLSGPKGYNTYTWMPGNVSGITLTVFDTGTYYLEITDSNNCKEGSDPFHVFMPDTIIDVDITGNLKICEGDSVILRAADTNMIHYNWNPFDHKNQTYVVYKSGTYQLTAIDSFGCIAKADSIKIIVQKNDLTTPVATDTIICAHQSIILEASTPIGTIRWYNQIGGRVLNSGNSYSIDDPETTETYYIRSVRSVCSSDYTPILLEVKDCDNLYAPNIFTPNGDGINDELKFYIEEATCFHLQIYNRWGLLLFESSHMDKGWNGIARQTGKLVSNGTYYYIVEYCKYNGNNGVKTGHVTLLRD